MSCDDNSYISYIKGVAGRYIYELKVGCVELLEMDVYKNKQESTHNYGQALHNIKEAEQTKYNSESDNKRSFNDECYTTKKRRPVTFLVFTDDFVNFIKVKYLDVPVRMNCKLSHVEVTKEDINITEDKFEVIGLTSGFTCSSIRQQISLDITQRTSTSQTFNLGKNNDTTTSDGLKTNIVAGFNGPYVGTFNFDAEVSLTNHTNIGKLQSNSTEDATIYSMGTTINYKGPGMALLVGLKVLYKIKMKKVPVYYHYTCEGGSKPPEQGTIDLTGETYGNVFFLDYHFTFNTPEECMSSSYPHECVASIKINNFIADLDQLEKEFYKCFGPKQVNIPHEN